MSWGQFVETSRQLPAAPLMPSRQHEDWKYVSLRHLQNWNFKAALKGTAQVQPLDAGFRELVFIDGQLQSDRPEEFWVERIERDQEPSTRFREWFASWQQRRQDWQAPRDLFEDLNDLRFPEGLFVDVPGDFSVEKPLVLRWISTSGEGTRYPRLWLRLGSRSRVTLLEVFESTSNIESLTLPVADYDVAPSAKLEVTRVTKGALAAQQISRVRFALAQDATIESLSVVLGAKLVRENLDVFVAAPGASARLHGLSFTGGEQVVDHHTNVDHVRGGSQTQQLYKSVLAGKSRAVFNGRVCIRHDAQLASSEQLNQNLLLSTGAEVDSKPQLEIAADDVKATHGSTIGQLNEDEIFYLLSRAIARPQAESLIRQGFTRDLLMQVSNETVRNWLLSLTPEIDARLLP